MGRPPPPPTPWAHSAAPSTSPPAAASGSQRPLQCSIAARFPLLGAGPPPLPYGCAAADTPVLPSPPPAAAAAASSALTCRSCKPSSWSRCFATPTAARQCRAYTVGEMRMPRSCRRAGAGEGGSREAGQGTVPSKQQSWAEAHSATHPPVGRPVATPRWLAAPQRRGCSTPAPSTRRSCGWGRRQRCAHMCVCVLCANGREERNAWGIAAVWQVALRGGGPGRWRAAPAQTRLWVDAPGGGAVQQLEISRHLAAGEGAGGRQACPWGPVALSEAAAVQRRLPLRVSVGPQKEQWRRPAPHPPWIGELPQCFPGCCAATLPACPQAHRKPSSPGQYGTFRTRSRVSRCISCREGKASAARAATALSPPRAAAGRDAAAS